MNSINKAGGYHNISGNVVYIEYSRDANRQHLMWGIVGGLLAFNEWAVLGHDCKADVLPSDLVWC